MLIHINKGDIVGLPGSANDRDQVRVGIGWNPRERGVRNFLTRLFGKRSDPEFEIDVFALMLDEMGRLRHFGDDRLKGGDVIFFNNPQHHTACVRHQMPTAPRAQHVEGVREGILLNLEELPSQYTRIVLLASIYEGQARGQHLGQLQDVFLQVEDRRHDGIVRYDLDPGIGLQGKCSLTFGELYRSQEGWKFRAIGRPHLSDSVEPLLRAHIK